jgi:DNA-binding NtrC family response regulator
MARFPADGSSGEALVSLAMAAARSSKLGVEPRWAQGPDELPDAAQAVVVSKAMQRLYELVARVARTPLPVLVLGETGSGKELVARAVRDRSGRAQKPFKALNCATIPAALLESVLFGHERGAFTGADRQAAGLFEQAQGGTVFLDEVGELSAQAQAALLRVLETKRVVRVGSTREIEVDARVVAATHRDLETMVRQGRFREDLMYRLDAVTLRVPPLRERVDEIVPLARLFLARARQQWGSRACDLSDEALYALEDYSWPGNVRQLRNIIERAAAVCDDEIIDVEDLPGQLLATETAIADATEPAVRLGGGGFRSLPDRVRAFEIELIRAALQQAHGNQAQAARILGLPRRTLANKVHAYGLLEAWAQAGS